MERVVKGPTSIVDCPKAVSGTEAEMVSSGPSEVPRPDAKDFQVKSPTDEVTTTMSLNGRVSRGPFSLSQKVSEKEIGRKISWI